MLPPARSWIGRLLPWFHRRLVVVDPGSRFIKLLVADAGPGGLRIVHYQMLTGSDAVPEEAEKLAEELDQLFAAAGPHERVLVLPQYRTISQVLDLPAASPAEQQAELAREARRLSGLDESALAFAAAPLRPFDRLVAPHWLTLCKREELNGLLSRFAPEAEAPGESPARLAEVTTSGQALFAAATVLVSSEQGAVLVDLRARNSVVALVVHGQGVSTATVPLGHNQLWSAGQRLDEAAFDQWAGEIRLSVTEWLEDHPESGLTLSDFRAFLGGQGATDPGLLERLNRQGPLRFEAWETRVTASQPWPMADYLVCYGAALLASGRVRGGISLLPAEARQLQRRHRLLDGVLTANVLLLGVVLAVLGLGFWQKHTLIERKRALTRQSQAALQTAVEIDRLYRELNLTYEQVYPLLYRQRQTLETLQSLAAVRAARTNDDFWYVLFADAATYQAGTSGLVLAALPVARTSAGTNPSAPRREFIAELCIPREGEVLRRILSDVVANLKRHVLFNRVDTLPPERRQEGLVDPRVAVSNRVFALAMEVAGRDLPPPRPLPLRTNPPTPAREIRRPAPATGPAP